MGAPVPLMQAVMRGIVTPNEARALRGLQPIELHRIGDRWPLVLDPLDGQFRPTRWTCSYCAGLRTGDSCEGCGAPREFSPQPRVRIPRPTPDIR